MSVRDEPLDNGDRWINCEFQVPDTMSAAELHALGNLLMASLMTTDWAVDCSVSTQGGGTDGRVQGGDFSFVIKADYEFPPSPFDDEARGPVGVERPGKSEQGDLGPASSRRPDPRESREHE